MVARASRRKRHFGKFMTFSRYRRFVALLLQAMALFLLAPVPAMANNIAARLVAEGPVRPGEAVTLAIVMTPGPGWHGYWRNPGDAGLGMTLDWTLPDGLRAGEPEFPVPTTLIVSGLMNHVYKQEHAVLVPLTAPAGTAPAAALPISVKARWLACTDTICVPEEAVLETTLAVAPAGAPAARDARFDGWRAALPAPLGSPARFALNDKTLRIAIPLPQSLPLEAPHLFIGDDKVVDYAAPQTFRRVGDTLVVELARARFAPISPQAINGVLRLNAAGDGVTITAAPGPVPTGGEPLANPDAPELPSLPLLLLAALAGGLLLNIMPCVFPILSLKALSLARAGESEAEARSEGLAYSAGVILACLALGALLLALRAGGAQIGWAFQLQEPLVVAGLLLLAVAITANLLGLFEFSVPGFAQGGHARNNAFATGLLAAFAATPCTGPFMAAAMGAALLLPVIPALALFAALGLGIALPFLAIAFVPALRRRLPRPGPWMGAFRRWMALPMGLTALALGWLCWRLGGQAFLGWSLLLTAVLVAALFLLGRRQRQGRAGAAIMAGALAAIALGGALILPGSVSQAAADQGESILPSEPFSDARLAAARAAGKPVFAYFTADWCLSCKVNEQVAIEREDVRDAFARAGVVVLRGDWTRRDPAITRYLTAHGAAGVPLYVWYPAGGGEPRILPQVLTPAMLAELPRR